MNAIPRMVRSDAGSENVIIRDIQVALRSFHHDNMSGENSFIVGRSTAHQRIEMVWSFLNRSFTQFWRNIFKDMIDFNLFNNADNLHIQCIRFCFLPVIQMHLDRFRETWNVHRIISELNSEIPTGIPNVIFYQPLRYGARDCSCHLTCNIAVLDDIVDSYTEANPQYGCSREFRDLLELINGQNLHESDLPASPNDAKVLFIEMESLLDTM
ncbi:hypothetical protein KP79_PYT08606 [Mizuhopecten yessoensis]|uniref:Integrase core domain-containing protein n=1 Tax=Mizuhopecten yessoensis TaxID=6573 RepID=A0A210R0N1_MIZYE|nr:hypothetical protein KP79_PYT08606 [Mizuhopecten yessoensis]